MKAGRLGLVWLLGVTPLPVRILATRPACSWSWRVGPVEIEHEVLARGSGSVISLTIDAGRPLEGALARTYGPIIPLLLARLARRAERDQHG